VDVDDAGGDEFAGAIKHRNIRRDRGVRPADRGDLAPAHEHHAVFDFAALAIIDGRAADRGGDVGVGLIGRGEYAGGFHLGGEFLVVSLGAGNIVPASVPASIPGCGAGAERKCAGDSGKCADARTQILS